MITCDEAVRRLWSYVDGDLAPDDSARVDDHLALCRRCCGEAEFTAALRDLLGATPPPPLPTSVERELHGFLASLEGRTPHGGEEPAPS